MKAVIFVGMPGSGKSMGAKCATAIGIPVIVMGDIVREEATRRKLSQTPKTLGEIMLDLRSKFGPAVIADRCKERISKMKESNIVIDGARSEAEIESFRQMIESVTVVAIHSSPKVRFQRLIERQRPDDAFTWETFLERDSRELDVGLGRVIAQADVVLVNEGEPKQLRRQVIRLLKEQFP